MATRWYIARPSGDIEDVGAESMTIHVSGALVFELGNGEMLAYAPGTWVTVHDEVDD